MKIKVELVIISILWLMVIISYLANPVLELGYITAIAGLAIATLLYRLNLDACLILLMLLLLLAVFNLARFSLAYNVNIYVFNLVPLILLTVLIIKRKNRLADLLNK